MADIDKITVNNTTYNVKDATARDSISWISRRWNTTSYSVGYSSEQSKLTLMINNLYSLDISESGLALYRNDGSSWTKVWQK